MHVAGDELAMANKRSPTVQMVTYKTAVWALLGMISGILCLLASNLHWFDTRPVLEATLSQLGGLLFTAGGLGLLWDLRGKRDLMDEILEKVEVSSDVRSAGLELATMKWTDVHWSNLLQSARDVEVFISRGRSWRNSNWPDLQKFASRADRTLRLYLPNPNHELTVSILAMRYDSTPEKERGEILDTASEMARLSRNSAADIRIYFRDGDPSYTCYRFDSQVIVSLYANRRERGTVPVMSFAEGSFYDFFVEDLSAIRSQSREVPQQDLLNQETPRD